MTGLGRRLALALLASLALASPAAADIPGPLSQWNGLPGLNAASGAQWVRSYAYSTPPNVVYAGLEGGGVFKSTTGGATWSEFNDGFPNKLITNVRALLTSSTGSTVYAGVDSGIWKSDGGAWEPMAQGPEDDPANPKKLNQSVQSLISLTGSSTMLAGVFSGGVYKSDDNGATWKPPAPNNGMPASETIYGLTSNVPGLVYASGGSGIYVSTDNGSTWTRMSDGIPGSASPITTWVWPQRPNVIFASTGSHGIYRSINGGITWSAVNDGLGAVRARGFQIFTGANAAHLYAATENGVWGALSRHAVIPPEPKWRQITTEGLVEPGASNLIMWSMTAPVIPGAGGAPGLIVGTQSNGGYFLGFEPPSSTCPMTSSESDNSATASCPDLFDHTPLTAGIVPQDGRELTANTGNWTGTETIEYAYQWYRCTAATGGCSVIDGAEESSYLVTEADFNAGYRFRVRIVAENDFPSVSTIYQRFSSISGVATANPANLPGENQVHPPGISPSGTINVGDTLTGTQGTTPSDFTDGWFNPKATSRAWQWYRCDGDDNTGDTCEPISGATNQSYTLTTADGTHRMQVRITGTNSAGSRTLESSTTFPVVSEPAAIADPILNPDTGLLETQEPRVIGNAWVGETLVGSVGSWKDPTTGFWRRWLRCDADGSACTNILEVASADPESGPTYVVREGDLGYTIRMRVFADVNGDADNEQNNFLPPLTEIDTAPTAVVTHKPPPGGGGGGAGGGADTTAPTIGAATLTKTSFVAGKGTVFRFSTSEAGSARIVIAKKTQGRRVGGKCKPKTRKNRRKKKCSFFKTVTTLRRANLAAGQVSIPFSGKVGKRKLRPGSYRATIFVTDAAGNTATKVLTFKIKRR